MQYPSRLRHFGALSVVVAATVCGGTIAQAQIAIEGFAIDQKITSCPPASRSVRRGVGGIACEFPHKTTTAFGVLVDRFTLAADRSGEVDSLLAVGIDANGAAAGAAMELGAPDSTTASERWSLWTWHRGESFLEIFYNADEPGKSNVMVTRRSR